MLNEVQQALFVDRHSRASGLTQSTTLTDVPLKRYIDTRNYVSSLSILREDEVIDPAALAGYGVAQNLRLYQGLLHDRGYLDYSGILKEALEALEHNDGLRDHLKARIQHVIVDEYQDVNPVQEAVVRCSAAAPGGDVCVVGDDDQTLYQWRGSDVDNILTFAKRYSPVSQVQLEENFRSSDGVVSVARDSIEPTGETAPEGNEAPHEAQDYEEGDMVALSFQTPCRRKRLTSQRCVPRPRGLSVRTGAGERRGFPGRTWRCCLGDAEGWRRRPQTHWQRPVCPTSSREHGQPLRQA